MELNGDLKELNLIENYQIIVLNHEKTFPELANYIEQNPEKIFKNI